MVYTTAAHIVKAAKAPTEAIFVIRSGNSLRHIGLADTPTRPTSAPEPRINDKPIAGTPAFARNAVNKAPCGDKTVK
eukprot:1594412-Amphidinium_carterae.1